MFQFLQVPCRGSSLGPLFLQNQLQLSEGNKYQQIMSLVLNWQRLAFTKDLRLLLNHIAGHAVNYLEFQLLVQQANISFYSKNDELRCRLLFQKEIQILKTEILQLLMLVSVRIVHTRQQYIVKLKKSKDELVHASNNCFMFWKERMEQKYGHVHQWFESLCQERDIRRVALPRFLSHLERILQDSVHKNCAKRVSLSFEKSKKNQIEFSVFMNTILIQTKSNRSLKRERAQSTIINRPIKKPQRYLDVFELSKEEIKDLSTVAGSSSKGGYESLREITTKRSFHSFLTPKLKMKKHNASLIE